MAKIRVCEIREQLGVLPDIEPLRDGDYKEGENVDVFFCALGFEPRCLAVPAMLAEGRLSSERAIYFEYETNPLENDANRTALVSYLSAICPSVESMNADEPDFTQRLRSLFQELCRQSVAPRVLVDIGAFGNRLAFKLYSIILDAKLEVTILYAEAAVYHPTEDEYHLFKEQKTTRPGLALDHGASNLYVSLEHPGRFFDPLPDYVMVFPAFDPDRSNAALEWIDPSLVSAPQQKVTWLVGEPHHPVDRWRLDAVKAHHCIDSQTPHLVVSTFGYKAAMAAVHGICETYADAHNLTLVPLASKLQALGAALACVIHPEIRVLFAVPQAYNAAAYSEGTKALWKLPLGDTEALRAILLDVGALKVE